MASNLQRTLILLLLIYQGYCQLSLSSVSLEGVSHISSGGDKVFASEGPNVYRYSTDLVEQQNVVVFDGDNNDVLGLTATPDGQWLIVCLTNDNCYVRNGSDISLDIPPVNDAVGVDNVVLFTATVPGGQSFYTGSYGSVAGGSNVRIRFGQYGFGGSTIVRESINTPQRQSFLGRNYYGGFSLKNQAYFVVIDELTASELRIVRICINGAIQSQYELQLECEVPSVINNDLLGASAIRGVSVINEETLVVGLTNLVSNRLCTFNISEINSLMDGAYSMCVEASSGGRNVDWTNAACNSGINEDSPTVVRIGLFC